MITPKISVIMPVYNGLPYVKMAIDSILAQEYPAHEIIVIDDGSKDGTPDLLASYGDKIITKRIPNSGGPATPKNIGMEMATGDYLAFLDHDDVWFKNKLKVQAETILKFPEINFVCSNYAVRYPHLNWRMVRHFSTLEQLKDINFDKPLKKAPFLLLLKENYVGTPSAVLLRRDLAKKAGLFRADHGPCDDYSYWIRCATLSNFVLTSDLLLYKRTHKTNLSLDAMLMYLFHKKVLQSAGAQFGEYIERRGWKNEYRNAMAQVNYQLGNLSFEKNKIGEAFELYQMGLKDNPTPENLLRYLWTTSKKIIRMKTGYRRKAAR